MRTLITAFCVTLMVVNSLAVPADQTFMDNSQLSDGGTGDPRPRKGKRDPGLPIPQSEERDENTEPNKHSYFRDTGDDTRPRKGRREPGLPIPQSEKPSRDEEKGHLWSDFDRQAKEIEEKVLKNSQISRRTFEKRKDNSRKRIQKRQAAKTVWEDLVDALQM